MAVNTRLAELQNDEEYLAKLFADSETEADDTDFESMELILEDEPTSAVPYIRKDSLEAKESSPEDDSISIASDLIRGVLDDDVESVYDDGRDPTSPAPGVSEENPELEEARESASPTNDFDSAALEQALRDALEDSRCGAAQESSEDDDSLFGDGKDDDSLFGDGEVCGEESTPAQDSAAPNEEQAQGKESDELECDRPVESIEVAEESPSTGSELDYLFEDDGTDSLFGDRLSEASELDANDVPDLEPPKAPATPAPIKSGLALPKLPPPKPTSPTESELPTPAPPRPVYGGLALPKKAIPAPRSGFTPTRPFHHGGLALPKFTCPMPSPTPVSDTTSSTEASPGPLYQSTPTPAPKRAPKRRYPEQTAARNIAAREYAKRLEAEREERDREVRARMHQEQEQQRQALEARLAEEKKAREQKRAVTGPLSLPAGSNMEWNIPKSFSDKDRPYWVHEDGSKIVLQDSDEMAAAQCQLPNVWKGHVTEKQKQKSEKQAERRRRMAGSPVLGPTPLEHRQAEERRVEQAREREAKRKQKKGDDELLIVGVNEVVDLVTPEQTPEPVEKPRFKPSQTSTASLRERWGNKFEGKAAEEHKAVKKAAKREERKAAVRAKKTVVIVDDE